MDFRIATASNNNFCYTVIRMQCAFQCEINSQFDGWMDGLTDCMID